MAWLVGLMVSSGAWHLWAVLADNRLSGCSADIIVPPALMAITALQDGDWLHLLTGPPGPKGPLAPGLGALFSLAVGDVVIGCRLLSVAAHTVALAQVYDLGRFLPLGRYARLWAPLYVAVSPLIYGWARLEFHEPLLAVLVLGALQLMLRGLRRPLPAVGLGLVMGLGLLTKLSYPLFMLVPGLWFLARQARTLRGAALLLLSLGVMAALACPWLWISRVAITMNFHGSSHDPELWHETLRQILQDQVVWLLVLGTAAALLLWWRRGTDRWVVALLWLTPLVCMAVFALRFHYWTRYMVPVYPIMALLCAGAAGWVAAVLPRRLAWALGGALALWLVVTFAQTNHAHWATNATNREYDQGMLGPDQGDYNGYNLATRYFRDNDLQVLHVVLPGFAHTRWTGMTAVWISRGMGTRPLELAKLQAGRLSGQPLGVLMIGHIPHQPPGVYEQKCPPWYAELYTSSMVPPGVGPMLRRTQLRCLVTVVEADNLGFAALWLKVP